MFGDLLRQFLNLCEVKMYVLAQTLGYDKTYLSKWINNVKLPPAKNIDSLAEQIAAVLVKQSSADARIKLAASCGLVQNDGSRITPKRLETKVAMLLKESYWETQNSRFEKKFANADTLRFHQLPVGRSDCMLSFVPGDPFGHRVLDDMREAESRGLQFHLDVLIDPRQFADTAVLCAQDLIRLLGAQLSGGIRIVQCDTPFHSPLPKRLLVADGWGIYISLMDAFSGQSYYPVLIDDPQIVSAYYRSAKQYLALNTVITEHHNSPRGQEHSKSLIYKNKRYLLSDMFSIFMEPELLDAALDRIDLSDQSVSRQELHVSYEKEFSRKKDVIIFESAIANYLNTGKLHFSSFPVTLPPELVACHIQGILHAAKQRKNLRFRILRDRNPCLPYSEDNASLFLTSSTAYGIGAAGGRYIVSPQCIELLNNCFDRLGRSDGKLLLDEESSLTYLRNAVEG